MLKICRIWGERIRKREDFLIRASLEHVLSCTFWFLRTRVKDLTFSEIAFGSQMDISLAGPPSFLAHKELWTTELILKIIIADHMLKIWVLLKYWFSYPVSWHIKDAWNLLQSNKTKASQTKTTRNLQNSVTLLTIYWGIYACPKRSQITCFSKG